MHRLLYPMRTYLVVSGRLGEEVDVMAADWVTAVSARPFIVAVAIAPSRYTFKLVKKYREFVISVPSIEMLKDVWIAGSEHGPQKLRKMNINLVMGQRIGTPIIKEALANLECEVIGEHEYGDHLLFVGRVVAYSYRENVFRDFKPDLSAGFVAHIALNEFASFANTILRVG
ncbi:MAG: flavin reductase family protein [Ignisphaera sp.]